MILAHIADTHIKNLKYHYEYKIVFEQLYKTLRSQKVDCIIHCGDIAHTKTQISPEFVEMCSDFFRSLAEIAPTYIILGNHDGNLKNSSRQDALTPIVDALNLPRLNLLKDSGETHLNDDFCLNVLSVFDRDNWVKPSRTDKINIALYHGSISRCKTDTNWTMSFGEDEITIFDEFDFAMLGDIHRRQFLDKAGRIWYAGSTVQQNHGETNDKGILIWDIKSKEDWEIEPIVLKNPKPFFTIPLTLKGRMPRKIEVPDNARLRLVSTNNLPLNVMRRAMDIAKHRFKPVSISFLNRASGIRGNVEDIAQGLKTENLRDPEIQEELIAEYLKDHQASSKTMDKVYELNRTYNKIIEEKEEVSRNVNWNLTKFEFDNLFNYGEKNVINFGSLNGIVGIFGKNFSGKSSVIDAALYTLFNTTSKNERKNLNVINQNRQVGAGKLTIECNGKVYTIERESKKYIKRLKGEETLEAKTELNFESQDPVTGEITSLNGTTRNQTDANIRKHFGSIDDFMVSSLASQHGALAFIDEGSTRRKEIIAKFLDLEIFDKKFKMAKEDSIEAKVLIKKHQNRDYDNEIEQAAGFLSEEIRKSKENNTVCQILKNEKEALNTSLRLIEEQILTIPAELINIDELHNVQNNKSHATATLAATITEQISLIKLKRIKADTLNAVIDTVDLESLLRDKQKIDNLSTTLESLNRKIKQADKKIKMLEDHEYDPNCRFCCENKFVKDARSAIRRRSKDELLSQTASSELSALAPSVVKDNILRYESIASELSMLEKDLANIRLKKEKNKNLMIKNRLELEEIAKKIAQYNENKEVIENLEELINKKKNFANQLSKITSKLNICESTTLNIVKTIGSLEQKIQTLQEQKDEYIELQNSYTAYDLFMQAMHANGIAYDIIKKKMPVINQEVARVLANIVEFEVFFESSGNKFDIFIKHPLYDERPIEMASGAEKTMAAMAIRLALLSVSSLPKGDLFILDEPGTALDEENMEGFIRILGLIKVYFKNVLLISHLDSLKDCVDMQIVIEKEAGFARINQ